jgi:hypothetical protein
MRHPVTKEPARPRVQTSHIFFRCEPDLPGVIADAAKREGLGASAWARKVLRAAATEATNGCSVGKKRPCIDTRKGGG